MATDESYFNKFPEDTAEIVALVREADLSVAIRLLQLWGAAQRDIGALKALEQAKAKFNR